MVAEISDRNRKDWLKQVQIITETKFERKTNQLFLSLLTLSLQRNQTDFSCVTGTA